MALPTHLPTHEAFNQSPPYVDVDLYSSDAPLRERSRRTAAGRNVALSQFGRHWGAAKMFELARAANENPPKLRAFDAQGFCLDWVDFHPAYHRLWPRASPPDCMRRLAQRSAPGERASSCHPRRALLHGRADRDRAPLPDHHDSCGPLRHSQPSRTSHTGSCRKFWRASTISGSDPGGRRRG